MSENLRGRCVDGPDCAGEVALRDPIGVPRPLPRCDRHWQRRLDAQRRFETLYCTHVADVAVPITDEHEPPAASAAA